MSGVCGGVGENAGVVRTLVWCGGVGENAGVVRTLVW